MCQGEGTNHTETEDFRAWVDPPAQSSATDTVKLSQQVKSLSEEKNSKLSALDAGEVIKGDPKLLIIKNSLRP